MKRPNKKQMKTVGVVVGIVALVFTGVMATLSYQNFISNVKAQGANEFKTSHCEQYSDKKTTWLECDL